MWARYGVEKLRESLITERRGLLGKERGRGSKGGIPRVSKKANVRSSCFPK